MSPFFLIESQKVSFQVHQKAKTLTVVFVTTHNEMKCDLSIKESNLNAKLGQNFHISLRPGLRG